MNEQILYMHLLVLQQKAVCSRKVEKMFYYNSHIKTLTQNCHLI